MQSNGNAARKVTADVADKATRKVARQSREASVPVRPAILLHGEEIARLVIAAICGIRTVQRWAAGLPVHRTTAIRLERAMRMNGIERRLKVAGTKPPPARRRVVEEARS